MKVFIIYLFFLGLIAFPAALQAQALKVSAPFPTGSPFLEPDKRVEAIKLNNEEFVIITKTKGGLNGNSQYVLEKYQSDLNKIFSTPLTASPEEDYKELFFNGKDIILFSVNHKPMSKESKFIAYSFDVESGHKISETILQEQSVSDWQNNLSKGKVRESFENSILSCLSRNFAPSLEYQYELVYSPDSNLIMSYIYDYGQRNMLAHIKIFDRNLQEVRSGTVPIDNGFVNYGIHINNKGELYIVNADKIGRIVVIQYNMDTKDAKLLDIQYSSTSREDITLKVFEDDIVYIANVNTKDGQFVGVTYSKFNFSTSLVEKINYHELSTGIKQTINAVRQSHKFLKGDENWRNYHLSDFIINEYEKIILVLEKKEIQSIDFLYESNTTNNIERWSDKSGKINTEAVILLSFNVNNECIWENFYLKSQTNDITYGTLSSSFSLDNTAEGKLRMIYSSSDNGSANYNNIHYVEWDEYNGDKKKDMILENEEKMTLMRNYILWWNDKFVVAGKKGLLGKKSFISMYKY